MGGTACTIQMEIIMTIEWNVQTVKDFFAAAFGGQRDAMLALVADDVEWIIPGEDWPLAGRHRGHDGLTALLKIESEQMEMTHSEPREFVAQGDRVLVAGYAEGKVKATGKPFKDDWIFAITVRDGKLTKIREYVDTQALANAAAPPPLAQTATGPTDGSDLRAS